MALDLGTLVGHVKLDDAQFQTDIKGAKSKVAGLKRDLASIGTTKARIDADASRAEATLKSLKAELAGLDKKVKIEGVPTRETSARIDALKAKIASITDAKAKISVQSAEADARIREIKAQLSEIGRTHKTATVKVEERGVNFAFRGISNLTTAIVGLAPVAVPALAVVTAGIGTLGSAMLTAGAAGGVFGAAVAGQAAAMKTQLTAIKGLNQQRATAQTAEDGYRIALQATKKGTPAYASALKTLQAAHARTTEYTRRANAAQKDFNSNFGPAASGLEHLKGAWAGFLKATRPVTIQVMGKALNLVAGVLPRLAPLANSAGAAVMGLVDDLTRFSHSSQFEHILVFFRKNGPGAITVFGETAGRILLGVFNVFRAFAPFQRGFLDGMGRMSQAFLTWSSGFGKSNGFHDFMGYAQQVLPQVVDLFSSLATFVGKFIVALGPLAGIELKGVLALLHGLNNLPPKVLTGIAFGITAIVLGLKAWEIGTKIVTVAQKAATAVTWLFIGAIDEETGARKLSAVAAIRQRVATIASAVAQKAALVATKAWTGAQWLLNAAMDANPIGLVVVAIGILVAAFIIAYKKSTTFRAIVNGALHAVKDAANAVVGWFTHSFVPLFTQKIPAAFHATVAWVKSNWPIILAILTGPIGLATLYITRHWDTITGAFSSARRWVVGAFRSAWSNVTDVLLKPIRAARDAISNIFGAGGPIRHAFSAAVSAIDTIWGKLKGYALAPVRFIVNTVYNNGIRKVVNAIPGIPGSLGIVKGFRTGGPTGSGRDDEAVGVVHGNEHVVTADEVRRTPGGHGTWERIRAAAMAGVLPGYKGGGAVWPTTGHITSTYPGHDGVDINGPGQDYGNPIYAWRSGRITYAGWNRGYGHAIFEQAPGYPSVVYGHGSAVYVHTGQAVRAGQMIGRVGSTGNSTGPHLHFGHPGGTSALAYALLRGAGSAGQGAGGTAGGSAYSGPSLGSVLKYLNPGTWLGKLKGMGGWGPMLAGTVGNMASSVKNLATAKIQAAVKAAGRIAGSVGNFVAHGPGAKYGIHLAPAYARQSAFNMMPSGWSRTALDAVVKRESGWRWNADNPYSSAYGIPQALPGSKMASAGPDWHDNALTQIKWMFGYIKSRYGTPSGALAHERSHGWYDQGGIASGSGFMQKRIIKPERVLSPRQTDLHDRQTVALEKLAASGGKSATGGLGPLIGHADIHTEVDLDKYERQRAFRERAATV